MALTNADWQSIYRAIRENAAPTEIVYGKVVARDVAGRRVKVEGMGDQWIPLVGFNAVVHYYDQGATGVTTKKTAQIEYEVPKLGELAVVIRTFGARRLSKCVGIILSKGNFVT